MKVNLLGALDYKKARKLLSSDNIDDNMIEEILYELKDIEKIRHSEIVSTAARLSSFPGTIDELVNISEKFNYKENYNFSSDYVINERMSILDLDYFVLSLSGVSMFLEQMIIDNEFASFAVKSRRLVDYSNSEFYIPDFYDKNGIILPDNRALQLKYKNHMIQVLKTYKTFIRNGINSEDARYILPYCCYSDMLMVVNSHTLYNMIIKFSKTKYSDNQELKEFAYKLMEIAREYAPYIIDLIDKHEEIKNDAVRDYLDKCEIPKKGGISNTTLTYKTPGIDEKILISALMRNYKFDYEKAKKVYRILCKENKDFKYELMNVLANEGDGKELAQVDFSFQIPISYAMLTHLTRHRTQHILNSDFLVNQSMTRVYTPETFKDKNLFLYEECVQSNKEEFNDFEFSGIRKEDLVYFTLAGNLTSTLTSIDGKTLRHIIMQKENKKSQKEIRDIVLAMHKEVDKLEDAKAYASILGNSKVYEYSNK